MPTLTQIQNTIAGLNGEGSVSDTTRLATYNSLINLIIEDIRSRRTWSFDQSILDVSFDSSGVSTTTLTDFSIGSFLDLREIITGNDNVYSLIESFEKDQFNVNDHPVWITGNDVDGYKLNTLDTDSPTLQLTYSLGDETALVNGTDETRVPLLPVSLGSYARLRRSDNYEADITREINDYEDSINKLRKQDDRYPHKIVAPTERSNYSIGQVVGE